MTHASATPQQSPQDATQTSYTVAADASASPHHLVAPRQVMRIIARLDSIRVRQDMPCIVEATDDDLDNFVAIFSYAGIAASGDTPDEAMRNLCETIELTFAHLSENEAALSPALKRKLDALQEYVRA